MIRSYLKFSVPAVAACLLVGLIAALGADSALAKRATATSANVTTIAVTAGKPSELAFKLSKFSNIAAGTVTFKVTNQGFAYHTFKICTSPVTSAAKNTCVGKVTKLLKHGQSATLTVKLTKKGKYEYLCSVSGHAAGGMKGLIGIGVKVATPVVTKTPTTTKTTTTTTTTSPATTTTPPTITTPPITTTTTTAGGGGGSADGCPPGKTIVSQGGGDGDPDDTGDVTDGDGCV